MTAARLSNAHRCNPAGRQRGPSGLTGLLNKIKPAVAATAYSEDRTSKNDAIVDAVARKNVELTMNTIRRESSVLAGMESGSAIEIAGAIYGLQSGVIDCFPV